MAARALIDRAEIETLKSQVLAPQHDLFAIERASGSSVEDAAKLCGFSTGYAYNLSTHQDIQMRIAEVLQQRIAEGLASRLWVEAQMVSIVRQTMRDAPAEVDAETGTVTVPARPANLQLAATVLMNLARFKGYIVDKSTKLNAKVDLSKIPPSQVRELFGDRLNQLSPGSRAKIEAITASAMQDGEEE